MGLRRAVTRLTPPLQRVVAYHLGWSDAEGQEAEREGGKTLRPAIVLLSAESVGAPASSALQGAVALELVHNFSLLHDDVMDGDTERRHRPTAWAVFGPGQAIVAGDALLALAHELLLEDPRPEAARAAAELNRAIAQMIQGQSEDLSFESRLDVTEEECLVMCERKTAALLAAAGAIGGVLGGAPATVVDGLRAFGHNLGMAYQAVDDVLGIWGDPSRTGKPAASDLLQRKKTVPIVHVLADGGREAGELAELLSGRMNEELVGRAIAILDRARARDWTAKLAELHLSVALDALDRADLEPGPVGELRQVAAFALDRDF